MSCVVVNGDIFWGDDVISVSVYLIRGEYDNRLEWPFRGDITVQLVNQISDLDHHEMTLKFDDRSSISSCSRVISGERAKSGCVETFFSVKSFLSTIQYLKDDCVRFKVIKSIVAL